MVELFKPWMVLLCFILLCKEKGGGGGVEEISMLFCGMGMGQRLARELSIEKWASSTSVLRIDLILLSHCSSLPKHCPPPPSLLGPNISGHPSV